MGTEILTSLSKLTISYDEFGAFVPTVTSATFWLLLVLGVLLGLGRHFTWNQYQRLFYPHLVQILQARSDDDGVSYVIS
jgi:hypothetical protein